MLDHDGKKDGMFCPAFNPFERGLLEGKARHELYYACALVSLFFIGLIVLDVWMSLSTNY